MLSSRRLKKKWDHRKIIEYAAENSWEEVARKVLQELRKIVATTITRTG